MKNSLYISLMLLLFTLAKADTFVVSLGCDCETAESLRRAGIRKEAYPLDWIGTIEFDGIIKTFESDFKNFLSSQCLERKMAPGYGFIAVHNTCCNIWFAHDFPHVDNPHLAPEKVANEELENYGSSTVENFKDYLPFVQEKYKRRIERMLELLKSKHKVIFIRSHISPREARKFVSLIEKKYPKLDFTLIAPYNRNDKKIKTSDYNIRRVKSFGMTPWLLNRQWWSPLDWKALFIHFDLINPKNIELRMQDLNGEYMQYHKYCMFR